MEGGLLPAELSDSAAGWPGPGLTPAISPFPVSCFQLASTVSPASAAALTHPSQHTSLYPSLSLALWWYLMPRVGVIPVPPAALLLGWGGGTGPDC